jgi:hypothetical protein
MSIAGSSTAPVPYLSQIPTFGASTANVGGPLAVPRLIKDTFNGQKSVEAPEKNRPKNPIEFLGRFFKTLWRTKSELGCQKSSPAHVHGPDDGHTHPEGEACSHTGKAHSKAGVLKSFVGSITAWFKDFWHVLKGDFKILFRDTPPPETKTNKP